jgi:signal transduction histidine kinase
METMEIGGKELIFSIFLPFLLFYFLLFVFLKRSKIFGEVRDIYYSVTALTISLISVLSLYSLGLSWILPFLAAFLTVLSFVAVYLYGVFKYSLNVVTREEKFNKLREEVEKLISEYEREKEEKKKEEIKGNIRKKLSEIENLARQAGKKIEEESWYKYAKERLVE